MPEAPAEEMQAEQEPAASADTSVLSLETVALNDSEDELLGRRLMATSMT